MMNAWYPFYPGDFGRDTASLSLTEDGAYRRMLDFYYATGAPLPADPDSLYRICRAVDDSEREAVESVARKFFTYGETDDRLHNKRADAELAKRAEHHERLSNAAKKAMRNRWGSDKQASSQPIKQAIASPQPQPQKEKEKKEGAPASPSLSFSCEYFCVTEKQDAALGEAFPWIDRPAEYRKAHSWLEANPERRPKKANRFLHNWFSRVSQPKGVVNGKDINEAVATTMRGFAVNSGITH